MGTTSGGHYVALVNSSLQPEDSMEFDWVCYDDTRRIPLQKRQVEDNRDAYVLFYQLRHCRVCEQRQIQATTANTFPYHSVCVLLR